MPHPLPALFWLSAAAFASVASLRICDPMLPTLAQEFGVPVSRVSTVVTLYTIGYGFAQLVHGPLGDRFGKRRYIAAATMLTALTTLLCVFAPGLVALDVARLLTGTIAAAIVPLAMAWIGDAVPYRERQATLAKFLNGMVLGLILGQTLGGFFADTIGWRWAFVFLAVVLAVSGWRLRAGVATGASSDSAASSESSASAGSSAGERGSGADTDTAAARSGMFASYAIVVRTRWARGILAIVGLEGMLVFGAFAFVPTWLHQEAGLPVSLAGVAVAAFGLGGFAYTTNAARLLRYFGETGLAMWGGVLLALGFVAIAAVPGFVTGAIACGVVGLGFHMLHNTLQTHATQMAPAVRGTAVAMFAMMLFLGQAIGVFAAAESAARTGYIPVFVVAALTSAALGAAFAGMLRVRRRGG